MPEGGGRSKVCIAFGLTGLILGPSAPALGLLFGLMAQSTRGSVISIALFGSMIWSSFEILSASRRAPLATITAALVWVAASIYYLAVVMHEPIQPVELAVIGGVNMYWIICALVVSNRITKQEEFQ